MNRDEAIEKVLNKLYAYGYSLNCDKKVLAKHLVVSGIGSSDRFTTLLNGSIEDVKMFAKIAKKIKIVPKEYREE